MTAVETHSIRPKRPRKGPGSWSDLLAKAAAIVASYDTPVTLRQLFYRLVAAGLIENRRSEYDNLCRETAEARRTGTFPELIDATRRIVRPAFYSDVDEAREELARAYRLDRTAGQKQQIWIGIEKETFTEQLYSWFGAPLGLPIMPIRGYGSRPQQVAVATEVANDGRPAVLLYAGDYDATGHDIVRYLRTIFGDVFDTIEHLALTREQVDRYALPVATGKDTDSRAATFILAEGAHVQVELEALDPAVLRGLFQAAITPLWDEDAAATVLEQEKADRKALTSV